MPKKNLPISMKDIKARMKVSAEGGRARLVTTGGNVIGTRNERFTFKGQLIGDRFTCTVVDFAQQNAYYSADFDSANIQAPDCIALSHDGDGMQPSKESPNRQSHYCDGCSKNAFGSAEIGRGKACKNQYRLVVIPDDTKDARDVETAYLTLPPTSIKPWNEYVQALAVKLDLPVWGVKTTFYFDNSDVEATFKLLLPDTDAVEQHTDALLLGSIMDMDSVFSEAVMQYPDFSSYEANNPEPKKRATAKRKAAPKAKSKAKAKAAPKAKSKAKAKAKAKAAPKAKVRAKRSKFS